MVGGISPTLIGLASAAMFALSSIGYRGGILSLAWPNYVMAATFTLAVGIAMQAVLLSLYLIARSDGIVRDYARLETVAVRGLHGRGRLAILVPGFRACHRRKHAHIGVGRSAVCADGRSVCFWTKDHRTRSRRHATHRGWRWATPLGVLKPVIPGRKRAQNKQNKNGKLFTGADMIAVRSGEF